jgi:protein-S-isoprenylcysteine O-methyltransferase Ste14
MEITKADTTATSMINAIVRPLPENRSISRTIEMKPYIEYITVCVSAIGFTLVIFRIIVKHDYDTKGKLTGSSAFLETLTFFLINYAAYQYMPSDWPAVHVSGGLMLTGLALAAAGSIVISFAMSGLGFSCTLGQEADSLRQDGLYRISRNPQIIGYALFVLGCAALWPSWYSLCWLCQTAAACHIMVLTEEEFLQSLHGRDYEDYCDKTPRYLGRVKAGRNKSIRGSSPGLVSDEERRGKMVVTMRKDGHG